MGEAAFGMAAMLMRDVWGVGLGLLNAMAGAVPGGPRPAPWGDASQAPGDFAGFVSAMAGSAGADPLAGMAGAARQAADVTPAMAEAAGIAMASTLRYGRGLAELVARHQAALAQAVQARAAGTAALPPGECDMLAEQLRTFLREVGETAMLEARRLEMELAQVSERLAQAVAPAGTDHARRWSVKP